MTSISQPRRTIAWFRDDLRIDDQPVLHAAMSRGEGGCLPLFLVTPETWERHHLGSPRLAMIAGGIAALQSELADRGLALRVVEVESDRDVAATVAGIAERMGADEVHVGREFGIDETRRDEAVAAALGRDGRVLVEHENQVILPVRDIRSGGGTPYTVFTPFKRTWLKLLAASGIPAPVAPPASGVDVEVGVLDGEITTEAFTGRHPSGDFPPGEDEPRRRLQRFLDGPVETYHDDRDPPALDGTSTLSPWLACGSLSPRRALHAMVERFGSDPSGWSEGPATWLSELVWREFYRHAMDGIPRLSMDRPLHGWTDRVAWNDDADAFDLWREGRTGIAIVDAGMHQLAKTGWMHNRGRMIVATFLTKHLLVDWRKGERFFLRSLADADFPSNNGGWQWAASTGTDAAPYFRVFNPDTQRDRFDPKGDYIRRWAPEHLDGTARPPVVDLKQARVRAIEAFKAAKNAMP
ncbi:MAG: deoxyribodipyrimidine photo-lyase [Phycisphaerae bacterium]|nr:deoxyribodipyrimidine photo-lyase [Phycisphaerae bacterium]